MEIRLALSLLGDLVRRYFLFFLVGIPIVLYYFFEPMKAIILAELALIEGPLLMLVSCLLKTNTKREIKSAALVSSFLSLPFYFYIKPHASDQLIIELVVVNFIGMLLVGLTYTFFQKRHDKRDAKGQ
jgi:MFS superfamily sulfate permease-like transporter